jgi:hypothetical protein
MCQHEPHPWPGLSPVKVYEWAIRAEIRKTVAKLSAADFLYANVFSDVNQVYGRLS